MSRVVREKPFDARLHKIMVNARVEIRSESRRHPGQYLSRVEDVDKTRIALMVPVSKGKLVSFESGEKVRLGYMNANGFFGFKTDVIGSRTTGKIPLLYVQPPAMLHQIERREFFRTEVLLPCHFNPAGRLDDAYPGTITNLSGGGCRFASDHEIPRQGSLELHLKIPTGSLRLRGRVVSVKEIDARGERRFRAEIRFDDVDEKARDRVIEYVFDRHRESIRTPDKD